MTNLVSCILYLCTLRCARCPHSLSCFVVTDEAVEGLVQGYLSMRSMGGRGSKTITATTRQLESLIRLAQVRVGVDMFVDLGVGWKQSYNMLPLTFAHPLC